MTPLLSVVMPSLLGRMDYSVIAAQLRDQIGDSDRVEFFELRDNGPLTTGRKMKILYGLTRGAYICGVGDDDRISDDYIVSLLGAIMDNSGVDAVTFHHSYSVNGAMQATVIQEADVREREEGEIHYRTIGPLCPVRREIVLGFDPPDARDREDIAYKDYLRSAVTTVVDIPRVLYHHQWAGKNKIERRHLHGRWAHA